MDDDQLLANRYEDDLRQTIRSLARGGYQASRWAGMINQHGGVGSSKRLLEGNKPSDGFTTLWERKQLGLSVEAWILRPWYEPLFTESERAEARRRLAEYEFNIQRFLRSLPPPEWWQTST